MTIGDIVVKYNLDEVTANFLYEYFQETQDTDPVFVPTKINTIMRLQVAHKEITGTDLTLSEVKSLYQDLPMFIRLQYGDNYLLGYIYFLLESN